MTNKQKIVIALKRFLKVFLSAFLTTGFAFVQMFGGGQTIIDGFKISIGNGFNTLLIVFFLPLICSCTTAGFCALAKFFRTGDYQNKIINFIINLF